MRWAARRMEREFKREFTNERCDDLEARTTLPPERGIQKILANNNLQQ